MKAAYQSPTSFREAPVRAQPKAPRRPSELERRFELMLAAYVSLLEFAESRTSVVDDRGNLVVHPRIQAAHQALESMTRIV